MQFWFNRKKDDKEENKANSPTMSAGEKWYNSLVYTGLNYWVNLGLSLVIADFFLHGKGHNFFKKNAEYISNNLTKITGIPKSFSKWFAEIGLGTFSLNSGGNIVLIPTKFLEDNKRKVVYWLNERLGVDQTAPDGHKMTADEIHIEQEQDKQSWPRMIYRRFLGWMTTTSIGMGIDYAFQSKLPSPQRINGDVKTHKPGQEVFTGWIKNGVNYTMKNFVPSGSKVVNSEVAQRYIGYAALDSVYTYITSAILHMTNGAHKEKMPHELEENIVKPENNNNQETAAEPQDNTQKKYTNKISAGKDATTSFVDSAYLKPSHPSFQQGA